MFFKLIKVHLLVSELYTLSRKCICTYLLYTRYVNLYTPQENSEEFFLFIFFIFFIF